MANRMIKRLAVGVMAATMAFALAPVVAPQAVTAEAAKTVKLSKKSIKITDFKAYKLSISNAPKKAKIGWLVSGMTF